jgi:hypothetical protein
MNDPFWFFAALMLGWVVTFAIGCWLIERKWRPDHDSS